MTIDEAIAHAREVAKRRMTEHENHYDKDTHYYPTQCKKCAEEHIQLAEWLEELKQYRAIGTPEELQTMKEHGGFTGVELANIAAMQIKLKNYEAIGTLEERWAAMAKQNVNKELESHDEKHILECCISLMQEMVNEFAEWYRWQHGEDAIEELDKEERFCFRKSYFRIVQELFLLGTNHSGGTSTRAKCEQLGVDSAEEIEFDWSDEE